VSRVVRALVAGAALAVGLLDAGCSGNNPDALGGMSGGPHMTTGPSCDTPKPGCPCTTEGQTAACGPLRVTSGNYTYCTYGESACASGTWGTCEAPGLQGQSYEGKLTPQNLGSMMGAQDAGLVDSNMACDPNNPQIIIDYSGGFDAGSSFAQAPDGGGLSLLQTTGSGVGCAMSPTVVPASQTITVTAISPTLTTTPANINFDATCGVGGAALSPSWTLSNYQTGTIDTNGILTVYSPVATTETVTATSGTNTGTGTANVVVAVPEVQTGVAASVPGTINTDNVLQATVPLTEGVDPNLKILYPYANTVFPVGLAAPTVQWDNKNSPVTYVKVSLRYPAGSGPYTFNWSIVLNGEPNGAVVTKPYTSTPAYTIPQYAWSGFDQSAAGGTGEIAVQRVSGSAIVYQEQKISVKFASGTLKGTAYYVQYLRNVGLASYTISNTCTVGNGTHVNGQGSQVYSVNPGSAGTPSDPFNGNAGCPVCHSLSGNGKTFISVDVGIDNQYGGGPPVHVGLDTIGAGGVFTQLADAPDWVYPSNSNFANNPDWSTRGFAYNAITYDGRYNLQAYNFWGNSNDTPPSDPSGNASATRNMTLSGNVCITQTPGTTPPAAPCTGGKTSVPYAQWNMYDLSSGTPTTTTSTGLGTTGMLTPSFSPDSTKLVYINSDSGPGGATGWKKGMSYIPFTEASKTFGTPVLIRNNWTGGSGDGNPMKWPFFEYDSRSVLFVETTPQEYCLNGGGGVHDATNASSVGCYESSYGNMSPTTRSYWPGALYSMDSSSPLGSAAYLTNLNQGYSGSGTATSGYAHDNGQSVPYDKDKAYQPTALPFASGGYRWVIFTSQRAYGNQVNPYDYKNSKSTDPSCAVGQLWIAALDDATSSGTTDRSHPAFWLPNQRYAALTANHYVNERGYLVPSACEPDGTTAASVCTVNTDCCNANCRIDLPVSSPPTRHCATPSGTCSQNGASCSTSTDCCNGASCINGSCQTAATYPPATYTRLYTSSCPSGTHAQWHLFEWNAGVPGNATIAFSAQTNYDVDSGAFVPSTPILIGTATSANTDPPPAVAQKSSDIDTLLKAQGLTSGPSVLVTMVFTPTTPGNLSTPVLYDWAMTFDCIPSE
jgi:hypothetical protein